MNLRLPNITASTPQGQLEQIRSYLYQFSSELQWALDTIESGSSTGSIVLQQGSGGTAEAVLSPDQKAQASFNEMKALIIKSADIVNAYYETIERKLRSEYTAISPEFGKYWEDAQQTIQANADEINQHFERIEEIETNVEGITGDKSHVLIRKTEAYIKSGLLETRIDGVPIYGLEVGQATVDEDGSELFHKFARFTADRLSFHNKEGKEIAWISGYVLHITNAEILGNLKLGKFLLDTSNGLAFKWTEGG